MHALLRGAPQSGRHERHEIACYASDLYVEGLLAYEAALRLWGDRMEVVVSIDDIRRRSTLRDRSAEDSGSLEALEALATLFASYDRLRESAGEVALRRALERVAGTRGRILGTTLATAFVGCLRRADPPAAAALEVVLGALPEAPPPTVSGSSPDTSYMS